MEQPNLDQIHHLNTVSETHRELLSTLGYTKISQLQNQNLQDLTSELAKANDRFSVSSTTPTSQEIQSWFNEINSTNTPAPVEQPVVEQEQQAVDLQQEILYAPTAYPIEAEVLIKAGADLDLIPTAKVAIETSHFICCTEENRPKEQNIKDSISSVFEQRVQDQPKDESDTPLNIVRTEPQFITNRTIKSAEPASKQPELGVIDPQALQTYFSALSTAAVLLSIYAAIICAVLLVFYREEKALLLGPASFVVFGLIYLLVGQKGKCCVCHQKEFVRSKRGVNKKIAHKIPLVSYLLSTSLHAIIFAKYRCMFCGSLIRLFGKSSR